MKRLTFVISILLVISSSAVRAEAIFSVLEQMDFGNIFFKQGICDMDPVTGELSNVTGVNLCDMSTSGTVGRYVITTSPNVLVKVKLLQRNNQGDGFIFFPVGLIRTIDGEVDVPTAIEVEVSSGSTGIVRLYVGGRLWVAQDLNPSTPYQFEQPLGIEWSTTP